MSHLHWCCRSLQDAGFRVGFYHAGMTPRQRSEVQNSWRADKLQLVVATIAFGMGEPSTLGLPYMPAMLPCGNGDGWGFPRRHRQARREVCGPLCDVQVP